MSDNTLHRYRFLSGFCFDLVDLDLYCYPWLPCHPKRVRVALVSIRKKSRHHWRLLMSKRSCNQ